MEPELQREADGEDDRQDGETDPLKGQAAFLRWRIQQISQQRHGADYSIPSRVD